jgi:hypothetical protein
MDYHEFTTKIRENLALSFLPGTTSDDRINADYWRDVQSIASLIHTEKLDGENNCLNRYGVLRALTLRLPNPHGHIRFASAGNC